MTSSASPDPQRVQPLQPGASPATIRSLLLPEDRPAFVSAYEAALDEARRTLDLTGVHEVIEDWRMVALVQADPARFRRTVRRAAEAASGVPVPEGEPFDVTRSKAGL